MSSTALAQPERLRRWYPGNLPPGLRTPLELLVLQGTRFCNLDCRYCYLPFRSDTQRLDLGLVDRLIPQMLDAGLIANQLSVAWHAGEPLVLPRDYYTEAFARIAVLVGPDVSVAHNIQTNAVLLDDGWADFIKVHRIRLGVSIDGPAWLHDSRRVNRRGEGSHTAAMAGIACAQRHGIDFSTIAVLTREALDRPDEIYDFFTGAGFRQVGFNVEEIEGINSSSSLSGAESAYRSFLQRVFERSRCDGYRLDIREYRNALGALGSIMTGGPMMANELTPFSILSMDVTGRLYTYSPELVDLSDDSGADYAIGHVDADPFYSLATNSRFAEITKAIGMGVSLCQQTCSYFDSCGGGAPANKLAENKSFASTETMHCRLTRQALTDVIEDQVVAEVTRRRAARAAPRQVVRGARRPAEGTPAMIAIPGARRLANRLQISPGTVTAPTAEPYSYADGARVPAGAWRGLEAAECDALSQLSEAAGPFGYVELLTLPPRVKALAMLLRRQLGDAGQSAGTTVPQALTKEVARWLGMPADRLQALGAQRQPPLAPTTTIDTSAGQRLGLHLDSWSRLPLERRTEAANRLCMNLGEAPRRLVFIRATIPTLLDRLRIAEPGISASANPTEIGRAFMARFPDEAVMALTVLPGEAYVAPTELVLHDGEAAGPGDDLTCTFMGPMPLMQIERVAQSWSLPAANSEDGYAGSAGD